MSVRTDAETLPICGQSSSSFLICQIIQQYAHLHRHNFRRAGQQGPTRTLTAALKRAIKQLLCKYSITQVNRYKRETRETNLVNAIPKNI